MHLKWPDGSAVESGGLNYPTDIYVVDAYGKHLRNLTHDAWTNYLAGWLRDVKRILYESVPSDRMRAGRSGIFSIKADGSARRRLASGEGDLQPEPSPDGHRILFARGRWVYLMRSDGTDKRPLAQTSFGSYHEPYDASWSPDGKQIAFVRGFATPKADSTHSALYVIKADGTGLRRLTSIRPRVETMSPSWSPDGRKIGFNEYRYPATLSNRTYIVGADGKHLTRLRPLDGYGAASWYWLSNERIVYAGNRLQSIPADGTGKPQPLHEPVRIDGHVWFTSGRLAGSLLPVSPDGGWIAFSTGMHSLSIAHPDGTHVRLATRKICCLIWSSRIEWGGN